MTEEDASLTDEQAASGEGELGRGEFLREVHRLRRDAHQRVGSRPRAPFSGSIRDEVITGTSVRRYVPAQLSAPSPLSSPAQLVFLHGGYGVFGDLDLQDAWCRRHAEAWGCELVSVDYPLAPEHSLDEAIDAVATVCAALATERIIICGDSAGAALALATVAQGVSVGAGLLLTNPNVDLTLARFDETAVDGPDASLSRRSFAAWAHGWTHSGDFVASARALPPTFIAVGRQDAVLAEARDLAAAVSSHGQRVGLAEYDFGHGFLSDEAVSADVVARARRFFLA